METVEFLLLGMLVYFVLQFRLAKTPFTSVGDWIKFNGINLVTYLVLGIVYVLLVGTQMDKMVAFGVGLTPNLLIDYFQTFKKSA